MDTLQLAECVCVCVCVRGTSMNEHYRCIGDYHLQVHVQSSTNKTSPLVMHMRKWTR